MDIDAMRRRLQDALEGECDGLAVDDATASRILVHVLTDPGVWTAEDFAQAAKDAEEFVKLFEAEP